MLQIWWLAASKGSNLHWLCLAIEIFTKQTDKISFAKLWVTIKQTDSKPAWKFSRTCSSNLFATNVKSSERLLIWSCHLLPRRKNSRSRPCVLLRLLLSLHFFFSIKIKAVAVAVPRQENVCANTHLNARLWLFHALDAFQYLRMDYTGLLTHWRLLATLVFKERKATAHYWIIEQNSLCRIFINSAFSSQFWRRVLKHSNNYHKGTVQKVITNSWRVFNCCDSRKELYFLNIISIVSDLFTRKSLRVP